jgi:stage V sporulation protein R
MPRYDLEDLRDFDEICIEKARELLPLEPPQVNFALVQSEEMYDIAARGLPGRYSHYQFGRAYERQKGDYDRGRGRIYELVINTRPVQGYLLDGNSAVSQLVVMAHVMGHATVFEHNRYFEPADKGILARVKSAAMRIDDYIQEHGRTRVENFIDSCEALSMQRSLDQFGKRREPVVEEPEEFKWRELFPEEYAAERAQQKLEKEALKHRFPRQPERDVLAFIEFNARGLEDWQRDVISIIRSERDYFIPQMKTHVLNEAFAVWYHQHIVMDVMGNDDRFTTEDFTEYASMNARVLHPKIHTEADPDTGQTLIHCDDLNPYLLGSTILADVERACLDPTPQELDRDDPLYRPWAGQADPGEMLAEICQVHDDASLIAEFLTPRVCEQAKLWMGTRTVKQFHDLRVGYDEFIQVRDILVRQRHTMGVPHIEIVDADGRNAGELWLEHRVEPNPYGEPLGLDPEYAKGTLVELVQLWGHPCVIKSIDREGDPVWYVAPTDARIPASVKKKSRAPGSADDE